MVADLGEVADPCFAVSYPLICYCHIIAIETCSIATAEVADAGLVGPDSAYTHLDLVLLYHLCIHLYLYYSILFIFALRLPSCAIDYLSITLD